MSWGFFDSHVGGSCQPRRLRRQRENDRLLLRQREEFTVTLIRLARLL